MLEVLSAEQMREVDRLTTERCGIPSVLLMENAARASVRVVREKLGGSVRDRRILILCGRGNNGGDGAAMARLLRMEEARVEVVLLGSVEDTKGDARTNFEIIRELSGTDGPNGLKFRELEDFGRDEWPQSERFDLFVDACFGTGLSRPVEGDLASFFEHLNTLREKGASVPPIVSVDIPSGIASDSAAKFENALRADATVTFTAPKPGNVLPPNSRRNGELHVARIGTPWRLIREMEPDLFLAEREDASVWLERTGFSDDSYKNKRGRALLVVGSPDYAGAAVLAGDGALSTGAGMVTVATSASARPSVAARLQPEVITRALAETTHGVIASEAFETIRGLCEQNDVLAVGSGIGADGEDTARLVLRLVTERTTPVVIDADGLNSLAPFELKGSDELPLILTPHVGEFRRLLGAPDAEMGPEERVGAVRKFAVRHGVILVLKGERTLIGGPDGRVVVNPTGNPGLGKAGNGDNLTGIITGFVAQAVRHKVDIFETVVAAVYTAGLAGDIAESENGMRTMSASDVRRALGRAFRELQR